MTKAEAMKPYSADQTSADHPEWPPLAYPRRYLETESVQRPEARAIRSPRGYVRPDARIEEEIHRALSDRGEHFDRVMVNSANGVATLSGHVDLRRYRYDAENIAAAQPFVLDVRNNIDVARA